MVSSRNRSTKYDVAVKAKRKGIMRDSKSKSHKLPFSKIEDRDGIQYVLVPKLVKGEENRSRWQKKAVEKLQSYSSALDSYDNLETISQAKSLERKETELLEETERLILRINDEQRARRALKLQREKVIQEYDSIEYNVPSASIDELMKTFMVQNADAPDEEALHYLRNICAAYVRHIDTIIENVSGNKQTFTLKIDMIDKAIQTKDRVIKELRKLLKKEQKSADKKVQDLREDMEDASIFHTSEIDKMKKRRDAIVKAWNNGLGEKCDVCGKVSKIDKSGIFFMHCVCRK